MSGIDHCFVCKYCHKHFVREDRYLQHECKQMKREAEFKSPIGQAAWHYYQLWMRQLKRMPPPGGSFMVSKYFRTFVNFAKFINKVDLPRPEKFIWLMVEKKYTPTLWMSDDAYTTYLEFLDRKTTPIEQMKLSVETLLSITDKHDIDVSNVFDVIEPPDIIHMLRTRRLSPWLLLFSKKFKKLFVDTATPEQRIIIESLIRPEYWSSKFENYPDEITTIKRCVSELGV